MINNEITTTKGMESAQKALEQAKNRVAMEKKKANERGDYNRKVMEIRGLIDFIAKTSASIESFVNDKARLLKNVQFPCGAHQERIRRPHEADCS